MRGGDGQLILLVTGPVVAAVLASVLGWIGGRASMVGERRRFQYLAQRDVLTGLLNRAGFIAEAGATLAAHRGRPVAMFVDVDGFKRINDIHGHAAGDAVLVALAGELQRWTSARGGLVARLGGDEFVVLLPACGQHQEIAGAARAVVLALTRTYMVPVDSGYRPIAVSATVGVGVAVAASAGPVDQDRLLRAADSAMYAARRSRASWSIRSAGADPDPAGPGTACVRAAEHPERLRGVGETGTIARPPRPVDDRGRPQPAPHPPSSWPAVRRAMEAPLTRS